MMGQLSNSIGRICLILCLWIAICGVNSTQATVQATTLLQTDMPNVLMRPTAAELEQLITNGRSFISTESRDKAAKILVEIDQFYSLQTAELSKFSPPDNLRTWLKSNSKTLGRWTPDPERAILATLNLQIDMLELLLSQKDVDAAAMFKKERNAHRVRKSQERYFGDARDNFIAAVLGSMLKIDKAQRLLGHKEELDLHFPVEAKNFDEVEEYLVGRLNAFRNRLGELND